MKQFSKIVLGLVAEICAVGMICNTPVVAAPQLFAPKHSDYRVAVHCR